MNTFNIAPLIRTSVDFDSFENFFDQMTNVNDVSDYFTHYDIVKADDNNYRLSIAVAGFSRDNIKITQNKNLLLINGELKKHKKMYLHRGIASTNFERKFQLSDHVEVVSAGMENGILHIDLKRKIPDELLPKKIEINEIYKTL